MKTFVLSENTPLKNISHVFKTFFFVCSYIRDTTKNFLSVFSFQNVMFHLLHMKKLTASVQTENHLSNKMVFDGRRLL